MTRTRLRQIAAITFILVVCHGPSSGAAPQRGHWWDAAMFSGASGVKRVTLSRRGVTLASVMVPDGVIVSVYADRADRPASRDSFHGRIEIRTRLGAGLARMTEMETAMATAPLVLSLTDGDVTVEAP